MIKVARKAIRGLTNVQYCLYFDREPRPSETYHTGTSSAGRWAIYQSETFCDRKERSRIVADFHWIKQDLNVMLFYSFIHKSIISRTCRSFVEDSNMETVILLSTNKNSAHLCHGQKFGHLGVSIHHRKTIHSPRLSSRPVDRNNEEEGKRERINNLPRYDNITSIKKLRKGRSSGSESR